MTRLSLRARLTLWYTLALLVVLCLFGADVLWQQQRIGLRRVDRELEALTRDARERRAGRARRAGRSSATAATEASDDRDARRAGRVAILDARGDGRSARAWSGLDAAPSRCRRRTPRRVLDGRDRRRRVARARAAARVRRSHARARSSPARCPTCSASSAKRRRRCCVGIPIVLLLAGGGGLWLASVGLRPITDMARRAARIAPTGLEDLGQTERTDELGQLAARVQRPASRACARRCRRSGSSWPTRRTSCGRRCRSCGRPPTSRSSREHRDEAEYREALAIVGAQARRLGRLVEDMLVLARADAGGYPLRPVGSLSRRGRRRVPPRGRRAGARSAASRFARRRRPRSRFAATRICCGGWC